MSEAKTRSRRARRDWEHFQDLASRASCGSGAHGTATPSQLIDFAAGTGPTAHILAPHFAALDAALNDGDLLAASHAFGHLRQATREAVYILDEKLAIDDAVARAGVLGSQAGRDAASEKRPKNRTREIVGALLRTHGPTDAETLRRRLRGGLSLVLDVEGPCLARMVDGSPLALLDESGKAISLKRPPRWKALREQAVALGLVAP